MRRTAAGNTKGTFYVARADNVKLGILGDSVANLTARKYLPLTRNSIRIIPGTLQVHADVMRIGERRRLPEVERPVGFANDILRLF